MFFPNPYKVLPKSKKKTCHSFTALCLFFHYCWHDGVLFCSQRNADNVKWHMRKLKICDQACKMSLKVACYLCVIPWDHVILSGFDITCINQQRWCSELWKSNANCSRPCECVLEKSCPDHGADCDNARCRSVIVYVSVCVCVCEDEPINTWFSSDISHAGGVSCIRCWRMLRIVIVRMPNALRSPDVCVCVCVCVYACVCVSQSVCQTCVPGGYGRVSHASSVCTVFCSWTHYTLPWQYCNTQAYKQKCSRCLKADFSEVVTSAEFSVDRQEWQECATYSYLAATWLI